MAENDFFEEEQKRAVERLREMSRRSTINNQTPHEMPPSPSFVKINTATKKSENNQKKKSETHFKERKNDQQNRNQNTQTDFFSSFDLSDIFARLGLPFFEKSSSKADTSLIVALLLILLNDHSDKLLLAALVYILL